MAGARLAGVRFAGARFTGARFAGVRRAGFRAGRFFAGRAGFFLAAGFFDRFDARAFDAGFPRRAAFRFFAIHPSKLWNRRVS